MQFDPGMEYRPDWGDGKAGDRILRAGHAQGGGKKADNSWLLLCSALTDGPYSYI